MSGRGSGGWLKRLETFGPQREALRIDERSVDYTALARAAREDGRALEALGLAAGDVVAVLGRPSAAGVALVHALLDRGIVLLPLNARLAEPEQRAIVAAMRPRVLWVAGDREAAREEGERIVAGTRTVLGLLESSGSTLEPTFRLRLHRPLVADDEAVMRRAQLRERGVALLLMTSGTSGRPKGALLSRDSLVASADASAALLGSTSDDRWLLCMPLFHIGGLMILVRSARVGASVVLHPDFEATRVARALETGDITCVSFVATMLERVLAVWGERPAPASLRLVLLGGGPAPDALIQRALCLGYPVAPTYGLTEAASQVATRPPGLALVADDDPAGGLVPLPGVELQIVDDTGRSLPIGEEGEIRLRGPIVMSGYLDDPEATRRALVDGWLATGDVGRLDAAGRLRVLDRRDDLIVSGGENVYPAELESLLESHPAVLEAGVLGLRDARFGARPVALVVLAQTDSCVLDELTALCRRQLAGYKQPRAIVPVDRLPRTVTGKLRRRALRALYEAVSTRGSG